MKLDVMARLAGGGKVFWTKSAIWAVALCVCARIGWAISGDGAGPDPLVWLQARTGWQAMAWLMAALCATPLGRLVPKLSWLAACRRLAGLWSFAFASAHMAAYVWLDKGLDFADIASDLAKRPFVAAGWAGFAVLLALGATSNRGAMRALGRRWKPLHRLAYAALAAGMLHWYWMRAPKNRLSEWWIWMAGVGLWALVRIGVEWAARRGRARAKGR